MTAQPTWGHGLVAIRPGAYPYWWFKCPEGHEFLKSAQDVRGREKQGFKACCPECAKLGKYAHYKVVAAE